ncbi:MULTISPECIES: HAMP domain-containing sensor histidine kinase [unclassified Caballeronia]|uniref:sensor histidine kinase n=1 Tax=unclassified Caballeronia TaxID=2646786 RepID=UPI001F2FEC51|nr:MULTISPECIES: HAMP domain-containing sensor histidine kinase [unclassified Caballeronia]MCE4548112.1 HAMP domain-containing histidine kinase [Caballeronia sp. PC1]MCE4575765.1 HAMP domain-containing histidine kinase [Caballeronia sp. CLC5]
MRSSLRLKVALVFSALTIVLLIAQALGVRVLAEAQEERLIAALIHDDMVSVLRSYQADPSLLPPFDQRLGGYVSAADESSQALPSRVAMMAAGTHEIIVGDREIHVGIAAIEGARLYRVYDFSAYEKHFKEMINVLMAGTGLFALLTVWLSYGVAGLLVRQVASLARQVKALRHESAALINPGRYDEAELIELVEAFNDYHRRMADMIAREKEFTGDVSHELRTPLTAIKTSCELLEQDSRISGKSRARLAQINRAVDSMHKLVNALLMLARDDSAQRVESVDLTRMIGTTLAPFAERCAASGVQTVIDVGSSVQVKADASALAIVLSNLTDNALRYTDHGCVRFSYARGRLHIEDTGSGIPEHALPHVFDRFYQASQTPSEAKGFGIGLSIVKKICDRRGWAIQIESEQDQGTRVALSLPLAGPASAAED